MATAPVAGLQPDPPGHIARMARRGIPILPSPVGQPTAMPPETGERTYLGRDGFLHIVPELPKD
jgi:hypothetical protein